MLEDSISKALRRGLCCCKEKSERTYNFLILGQAGSGKTTFIDSFVNYLTGINFYDPFRYKLVDERAIQAKIN